MNPYSAVIVQQQLDELRAQAAEARLARTRSPKRSDRFGASLRRFAATVTASVDEQTGVLPRLSDYPYRG